MPLLVPTQAEMSALEAKVDENRVTAESALAHTSNNAADIDRMADDLDTLSSRVLALELKDVPPVDPPDPEPPVEPSTFDLLPNEGKFIGPVIGELGKKMKRPNELTRGRSWPQAHVNAWNGMGWDKETKTAWLFGGGHNDSGDNAVSMVQIGTDNLTVIKQGFELKNELPDGTHAICPRPRDFGDDKGPDSRHTYDGVLFRQKDRCFYIFGGFPYTCNGAIAGRPVDIQKINWGGDWSIVRPNIRDDKGRVSNGGSSSYAADELSNGDIAIIAKGYCRAYDPDTDTYKDNGGPGNRNDLGSYSQVVPVGGDTFFVYDYHRNYRVVRYRLKDDGAWGIGIGQKLGELPTGFGYVSAATFCKGWVVGWNGNNRMFFYNVEKNIMRVADYEFREQTVGVKMTASKMQVYDDDILVAIPRWQDQAFVFRMPDDPMAVTHDPTDPPMDLQPLLDAAQPGDIIQLGRGSYEGCVVTKDNITIQAHAEGSSIVSYAESIHGIGGIKAGIVCLANNTTLRGLDIRPGRYGADDAACVRVVPRQLADKTYIRHKGLTIHGGALRDSHNGILTDKWALGPVHVEDANFNNLGNSDGLMHAIYYAASGTHHAGKPDNVDTEILHAGEDSVLNVVNCTFDDIVEGGHAIKSGALRTNIRGGTINLGEHHSSRAVDCYAGGRLRIEGTTINQVHPKANNDSIGFLLEAFQRRHMEHSIDIVGNDLNGENMGTVLRYRGYATPDGVVPPAEQLQADNDITGYRVILSRA